MNTVAMSPECYLESRSEEEEWQHCTAEYCKARLMLWKIHGGAQWGTRMQHLGLYSKHVQKL